MIKLLKLYFRTVKFAMRYKWYYLMAILFSLMLLFFTNYAVYMLRDLINAVSDGGDILRPLAMIVIVLALPLILEPAVFLPKGYVYSKVIGDLIAKLYSNIMSLDYKFHTDKETGKVVSKIMNSDIAPLVFFWNLEYWVWEHLSALVIPLFIMFFISWEIVLITLLSIIIAVPIQVFAMRLNIKRRAELKETEYSRNSAIIDGVSNYETVRVFARKNDEVNYLTKLLNKNVDSIISYQKSFRIVDFTSRLGGIIIFCSGAYGLYTLRGSLDVGAVVVIVTYLMQISNRFINFVFSIREIFKNLPIIEDIYELMDIKSALPEPENPVSLSYSKGKVEFKNVKFSYNGDESLLKDVSLKILPGQTVAFVGPSGGGKTTLVRLLLRYYDVISGSVEIDGLDVRKLGSENVNSMIGVVPQEPVLFNRSLKYNIGYALTPNEDDIDRYMDKVIEASAKAQILGFIESLPNGFNTVVGERGLKLSGGQKQRVAIARVLIKNPKIIIFDEATSMLDSESEGAIQKAFKELSKDSTTIVIAHRLSTIKDVDRIFVVDKGTIVEEGRHKELVQKGGLYSKLWELQSGGFKKE